MKKLMALLFICMGILNQSDAQIKLPKNVGGSKTITIEEMPTSTEAFLKLRDKIAGTPEGGAVLFVLSTIKYTQDPVMGRHWAIISTDPKWLSKSNNERAYKNFDLGNSADFSLKQLDSKPYIPFSYVKGATHANGYNPGSFPYKIEIERSADAGDGMTKVFIKTSGADTARPITMNKNDAGVWKGYEYSSIFVGVKPPVVKSQGAADGDF